MERRGAQPTLGKKVRHYREAQQMGLTELARMAGISRSYLYQIENGESSPTVGVVKSLATALGATLSDLVDEHQPPTVPESLREFAEQNGINAGDVEMLAQINYRGRRPATAEEWRLLWRVIKASVGEE